MSILFQKVNVFILPILINLVLLGSANALTLEELGQRSIDYEAAVWVDKKAGSDANPGTQWTTLGFSDT